jgi:murein tripeptide amidase MpaA
MVLFVAAIANRYFHSSRLPPNSTRYFFFISYGALKEKGLDKNTGAHGTGFKGRHQDDYNGETFVYVENAKGGWIPKDADIMPYTPGIWDK